MSTQARGPGIYPSAILLGTLAGVVSILNIPPLIWHCRNKNIAAASLVSWILLNNIINVINAIIWPNDDWNNWYSGRGLCDIEVKIQVGRSVALPAAMFCILKSLANVMNTKKVNLAPSKAQRIRKMVLDLSMCIGLPLLIMIFHYIVQPNRYALVGVSGCEPTYFESWLTILLLDVPFLLLAVIDVYFAALIIYRLRAYRVAFSSMLESSNTTKSRFLRLFILSIVLILILTPVQAYIMYINTPSHFAPYSWAEVHQARVWNLILYIQSNGVVSPDRWANVGCGALVFIFFGMGRDAVASYRAWLRAMGFERIFPCLKADKAVNTRHHTSSFSSFGSRTKMFVMSKLSSNSRDSESTLPSTSTTASAKALDSPTTPKKTARLSGVSDVTEPGDIIVRYDDYQKV